MDDQLFSRFEEIAKKASVTISQAKLAKEKLRHYKALLEAEYLKEGMSVAKAQVLALADPQYKERLDQAVQIIAEAEIAKSEMEAIKMRSDWQRTKEATKRAEMQLR